MVIERDDLRMWREYQAGERLPPVHPGEILQEDYMAPLGLTQSQLARDLGISFRRLHEIVNGKRAITAETSLRLAKYFGVAPGYWLSLQLAFDLRRAMAKLPYDQLVVGSVPAAHVPHSA